MRKPNSSVRTSPLDDIFLDHVCGKRSPNPLLHPNDLRLARLLVLLHELDQSLRGLDALPELELSEIVGSAIDLCGFVDPLECREVIATILAALEMRDPIPDRFPNWVEPSPVS
jgi:hypothetical protein